MKNEVKKLPMAKSKKNTNKAKLNLTVRDEQRNKLEQMASLERRIAKRGHATRNH